MLEPMTAAEASGARLMGVPDTVIAGAPGTRVWLPIMYAPAALGVMVWEPIVRKGEREAGEGRRDIVWLPITACVASGARLMGVLDIVMAGPPGMRVWPSMM